MWQRFAIVGSALVGLCGAGCEERSEVIARELLGTGGGLGDGGEPPSGDGDVGGDGDVAATGGATGDGDDGGVAGAPDPGTIERPRFATPVAVEGLNDPDAKDQDPSLTADHLEIFFFTDREGASNIWRSTRSNVDAAWEPPAPVTELNTAENEQNPTISRDGLRIWFYSRREPLGIYFAERPSRAEPFSAPEVFAIDTEGLEGFPIAPSLDESELRMTISIGTATSRDLYEIVRPSPSGAWSAPVLLSGVNTADYAESTPFLIDDGREMLFHTGRSGAGDLFWAYRPAPGLPFTQVAPLDEVNAGGFESYPHLTADGRFLYFGSDREGNTDIFRAEVLE